MRWDLGTHEDFHYLNQSGCSTVDGMDDLEEFHDVQHALSTIDVPDDMQVCSLVLHFLSRF